MTPLPTCFKAYDIRGRVPEDLDTLLAYRIGRATAEYTGGRSFVVGHDCRDSSPDIAGAVIRGLNEHGTDVLDIGLCGTEQVYYTTFARKLDGGIMVTASHNPVGYSGLKLVREEARPISGDTGLHEIGAMTAGEFASTTKRGFTMMESVNQDYADYLLTQIDVSQLQPLKIVVNAGNGCAGPILDLLEPHLPVEMIKLHHEPDGSFPNGVPNPLLPENRAATAEAVRAEKADLGLAWDGDFDRCFFFDADGDFVEGYYLVGLLARAALRDRPGAGIIHDPRLTWNTIDIVEAAGGRPLVSKTGHAFIKERMRAEDAVYGGEMSAHHYFRDFSYCDNGMLPWLYVLREMALRSASLAELVGAMRKAYPVSGEINRSLSDPQAAMNMIRDRYAPDAVSSDKVDGLSLDMGDWRFNLRASNTEPVVRLNVESRGDQDLVDLKTREILEMLDAMGES
jgi:phosphomannomutase